MAAVDLYGADAQKLRSQYQTSLGRDASDDEISGWLTGSYGGGGMDQWLQQISTSHEAQSRIPQQTAPRPPGSTPGVNTTLSPPPQSFTPFELPPQNNQGGTYWNFDPDAQQQIWNWYQQYLGRTPGMDDYLAHQQNPGGLPGIEATIRGSAEAQDYARRRPATPTQGGAPGGAPQVAGPQGGNYQSWFMGLTGGRPPSPQSLVALEPTLAQYGIRLGPKNARGFTDGIILPDGTFVDVIMSATETGGSGWGWIVGGHGGGAGAGAGVNMPGNQYSDPYTRMMEEYIRSRIGSLQQPVNDPFRDQYMQAMQRRTQALQSAEPDYQRLLQHLEQRFADLQGPGYTGAENEVIRTQSLDPIENDRTAAKKRMAEQLAARNIGPDSGVFIDAMRQIDSAFDGMRGTTQNTLTVNDLNRRESRQQRADNIRSGIYDIGQARSREQLDTFSGIDALSALMRQETDARSREQISLSGALADLGPQRMQLAMQAAGMGGSPQSMFQSLMQMAQLNQNSALLNQRNSGQLWSGLGSLAYTLMNAGR